MFKAFNPPLVFDIAGEFPGDGCLLVITWLIRTYKASVGDGKGGTHEPWGHGMENLSGFAITNMGLHMIAL